MRFSFFKRLRENRKGSTMVYAAVLLPVAFGFLALGLDVASWHLEKRGTQSMSDATALAAALNQLDDEDTGDTSLTAEAEAAGIAAALVNGYDPEAGQTLVINKPPTAGVFAGNDSAIEAIVRSPLPVFLSVFYSTGNEFTTSRAVAVIEDIGDGCLWALNPTKDGALTVKGTAEVILDCGVYVNSDDTNAAVGLNGKNACLTATEINIVGGADGGAGNCFDPMPSEGATKQTDPLKTLPEPPYDPDDCDVIGDTKLTGKKSVTLTAGTYCGDISINTSELVHFDPGIYIINGGSFTINGQANVTGEGVMFFLTENNTAADTITINGGANVDLTGADFGDYKNILFYQSQYAEDSEHKFNGGSEMKMNGIMYFPNQHIKYAGNSETDGALLIADTITFTGTSAFTVVPGKSILDNPFLMGAIKLVE